MSWVVLCVARACWVGGGTRGQAGRPGGEPEAQAAVCQLLKMGPRASEEE